MKKIAFFIMSIIGILAVITWMADTGLKEGRPGGYAEWNDIISGKASSDILIMGSSRACVQVSPSIIEEKLGASTYNLGLDGYTFDMQKAKYDLYRKYNEKPKTIVQILDFGTFKRRDGLYRHEQFYPYYNEKIIVDAIKGYEGYSDYRYRMPMFKYIGEYKPIGDGVARFFNLNQTVTSRKKGYLPHTMKWNGNFDKFKELYPYGRTTEVEADVRTMFEEYLATARKEGVEIVLVYAPEYVEVNPYLLNKDEILKMYRQIADENGVRFYDYSQSYLSQDKAYMYDSQHLNKTGAELFTREIAELLKAGPDNTVAGLVQNELHNQ